VVDYADESFICGILNSREITPKATAEENAATGRRFGL